MAVVTGTVSFVDKAKKPSSVALPIGAADLAGWISHPTTGPVADLFGAINAMTLLTQTARRVASELPSIDPAYPTDDNAYRSSKLTVFCFDGTTGAKSHFSIPGRDATKYTTYPGTKDVILTVADGGTAATEALVTAIQAAVYSEDGNLVTVRSIVVAGANQG